VHPLGATGSGSGPDSPVTPTGLGFRNFFRTQRPEPLKTPDKDPALTLSSSEAAGGSLENDNSRYYFELRVP
jgi:hypothetical protein